MCGKQTERTSSLKAVVVHMVIQKASAEAQDRLNDVTIIHLFFLFFSGFSRVGDQIHITDVQPFHAGIYFCSTQGGGCFDEFQSCNASLRVTGACVCVCVEEGWTLIIMYSQYCHWSFTPLL